MKTKQMSELKIKIKVRGELLSLKCCDWYLVPTVIGFFADQNE
jgi:hypothetical protein